MSWLHGHLQGQKPLRKLSAILTLVGTRLSYLFFRLDLRMLR